MSRYLKFAFPVLLVAAVATSAPSAQQVPVTTVADNPACRACRIEFAKTKTVRSTTRDSVLANGIRFTWDKRWLFYASTAEGKIALYDSSGRFVRAFGSMGEGPGEIRKAASMVAGGADSLWVYTGSVKFAVFSPQHVLARAGNLEGSFYPQVLLPNGEMMHTGFSRNITLVRTPDQSGSMRKEFVLDSLGTNQRCSECRTRRIALARNSDAVWVMHANKYRIEKWSLDGKLLLVLNRQAPWFLPRTTNSPNSEAVSFGEVVPRGQVAPPPPPIDPAKIAAMLSQTIWLMEDADGLLWVGVTQKRGAAAPVPIVEVIDPVRGELLARADVSYSFNPHGGGWGWLRQQSPEEYFSFDVVKLTLRRN